MRVIHSWSDLKLFGGVMLFIHWQGFEIVANEFFKGSLTGGSTLFHASEKAVSFSYFICSIYSQFPIWGMT